MKNNLFWRIATAAVVVGSVIGTYAVNASTIRSSRRKGQDAVLPEHEEVQDANPLIPPGALFGIIWPFIYTGTTALSIHQALPSQLQNQRYAKSTPWLAASYVLNQLFGFFFASDTKTGVVGANATTMLNLIPALGLHQSLEIGRTPVKGVEKWLRIPVSVYAGWLTAASVLGATNLLITAGWKEKPGKAAWWAGGLLAVTDGLGYWVSRRLNDPIYMVPFVAAFSGIAAKQYGKNNLLAGMAGASALGFLSLLVKDLANGNQLQLGEARNDTTPEPAPAAETNEAAYTALNQEQAAGQS